MKKSEIKRQVEQKAEAHLPKAIKEEAEYRARDQVREAMREEREETPAEEAREQEVAPRSTVVHPTDPRLCGGR